MHQLLEFAQAAKTPGTNPQDLPYFKRYFAIDNAGQTTMPKFINYISHDEILGAFYRAIGWNHLKGALPASSLYFEFYTKDATMEVEQRFLGEVAATPQKMVRIFFNDTAGQDGIQVDLDNKNAQNFELTLDQFESRV